MVQSLIPSARCGGQTLATPMPVEVVGSLSCEVDDFADLLRCRTAVRFRASGGSMAPLVRSGDVLLVEPLGARPVRIGDVVLCAIEPGRVVAHRVIRREAAPDGYRFTVQGDRGARPDGVIPQSQVYGRVAAIERGEMHIDMNQILIILISRLAASRARWSLGRSRLVRGSARLLKRLPGFSRYLA